MSALGIQQIKRLEGEARMDGVRTASRSAAEARDQQARASLVGGGHKWRITNLKKAVRVMATWR
ncbi:MAG: hypothetical protein RIS24_3350 [Verrucomicrobiota bacterium]|jgi:hypothetical protein